MKHPMSIALAFSLMFCIPVIAAYRCKWAQYFYGILQVNVHCDDQCSATPGNCDADNLNSVCKDGNGPEAPCDFRVWVQTVQERKAKFPYYNGKWPMQEQKNPGNYILGNSDKKQYMYHNSDSTELNAGDDCFKLSVTVMDDDTTGRRCSSGTIEEITYAHDVVPVIPSDGKMEPQFIQLSMDPGNRAGCKNSKRNSTGRIKIKLQVLVIPWKFAWRNGTVTELKEGPSPPNVFGGYKWRVTAPLSDSEPTAYVADHTVYQSLIHNKIFPCGVCIRQPSRKSEDDKCYSLTEKAEGSGKPDISCGEIIEDLE